MYTQIIQEGIKRHGLIIAHASTLGWILSGVGLTDPQDISLLHCSVDEKISYTKPINIQTDDVEGVKVHNSVIGEALVIPPDISYENCNTNLLGRKWTPYI